MRLLSLLEATTSPRARRPLGTFRVATRPRPHRGATGVELFPRGLHRHCRMDIEAPVVGAPVTPVTQLIHGLFGTVLAILRIAKWLLTFCSITLPSAVYRVLHYSMTLRLTFPFLALWFVSLCALILLWLRYWHWNRYEHFREEPIRKQEPIFDLDGETPETNDDDRGSFHWYLDEFLRAIRIFGFLERPVFHELARHLQTRRLVAGDVLSLDSDYSFYIVVDGQVQVFAPTSTSERTTNEFDAQDYQLINEVGSGGTLSSLFTILRLFTEHVQLGFTHGRAMARDDASDVPPLRSTEPLRERPGLASLRMPPRYGALQSPSSVLHSVAPLAPTASPHLMDESSMGGIGDVPESPLLAGASPALLARVPESPRSGAAESAPRLGTMARATSDTTLAVIPAEAFRRLTAKFPSAASHIVQVILTRLARVTFHTAHQYLGLTREVMQTEHAINENAKVFLPEAFYEQGAIEHLWRRFAPRGSRGGRGDVRLDGGSPSVTRAWRSLAQGTLFDPPVAEAERPASPALPRYVAVGPGDLLSMVAAPLDDEGVFESSAPAPVRHPSLATLHLPVGDDMRRGSVGDASSSTIDLREEVFNCIASSIGLTHAIIKELPTSLTSPFFSSQPSSFANLTRLDASTVSEESMTTSHSLADLTDTGDPGVEIQCFPAGAVLARAGEAEAGLFYVIDGFLDIALPEEPAAPDMDRAEARRTSPVPLAESQPEDDIGNALDGTQRGSWRAAASEPPSRAREVAGDRFLFSVGRGGIAGYLSSLLGVPSYVDILAKTDVYVGHLPIRSLERMVEKRPNALLTLSKRLLSLLPPLILHIDAALDWQHVPAGQVIFRQGDAGDSLYIVINGRLRGLYGGGTRTHKVAGEYGQGDSVGELDVITRSPRSKTLHSIRDSELARMPITLFNAIALWHPPITIQISRIIARRMRKEMEERERVARMTLPPHIAAAIGGVHTTHNYKTVALVPTSQAVPIAEVAQRLQVAFRDTLHGRVTFLNQHSVMRALGRHAFSRMGKLKLAGWLAHQEQDHRLVLYVVDTSVGASWAQTSIRQADCILLVGFGDDPQVGEFERLLLRSKTTARKELVLLHAERSVRPGTTRAWLQSRPWISAHHHVELPGLKSTAPPAKSNPVQALRKRLETHIGRPVGHAGGAHAEPPTRAAHLSDFARLARRLCGQSIGLVLGGGGARGCAHIGVLRAFEEQGIPVDMVGGTSIGSFVGGLYARDGAAVSSHGRAKRFAGRMASLWRFIADVTYPLVSYTTGHEFNRGIFKCFADTHIEDMWLPYFCNTTNITWSRMEVHTSGYAWRYIRGSMTLAGLLPPLIDNGHMLVDGGYMDNLPVSIMLALGARTVFAIDVSSVDDTSPQSYGDTLSGWWVLLNRLNPWSSMRIIPSIPDIQSRLMYTTSVAMLEDAKAHEACLYLRMPVLAFGTLEFGKYNELLKIGYDAALRALREWQAQGRLPIAAEPAEAARPHRGIAARRNSL